jgi:cell division protein FtsB
VATAQHRAWLILGECVVGNESKLSLSELNDRIAILRDNIRQLVEQAAGASGAETEERISERIDRQNEELEKLTQARDALLGK